MFGTTAFWLVTTAAMFTSLAMQDCSALHSPFFVVVTAADVVAAAEDSRWCLVN